MLMKCMERAAVMLTLVMGVSTLVQAQGGSPWRPLNEAEWSARGVRSIQAQRHSAYAVDELSLRAMLQDLRSEGTIALPLPEGGVRVFRIWPNGLLSPELAERYPEIRTFSGQAMDDPSVTLRLDITPQGVRAMAIDPMEGDWFLDPYVYGQSGASIAYRKKDFRKAQASTVPSCSYDQVNDVDAEVARTQQWIAQMGGARVGDSQLRTYRLALACTAEYANFHGSNTTNNDRSSALGAMVTTMNRVNGIFERDVTLTMVLVSNTDDLIYLSSATDPFSNGNGSAMLGQNQTACDNIIGSANYDIGHVFSTGGGGVAFLNSPCNNSIKAGGVTGQPTPVGDPFDIDYVAHEMGHQFGGNHTQNNSCQRASSAAFEPGSASTIMGYAGICVPNVQQNSDAYFHGHSMAEMAANINVGTSSSCPQTVTTINQPPTVSAGGNFSVPRSTPFVLTATGSDPDPGNSLTYCWEQMNNQVSTQPPAATSNSGPSFRSVIPTASPQRYFPNLSAIVANTTPTWEVLSSVARTYAFRVTARDNVASFGCNAQGNMSVSVAGNSGPFVVTQPNSALTWTAGSQRTVTWNVAGTTAAPVSCSNVDILLSLDGGFTYPETLAVATPNDGSQSVTLPGLPSTINTARIMVRGSGNIFFDISNSDFTITASAPGYAIEPEQAQVDVCQPSNATYSILTTAFAGYSQPITFSVTGLPNGPSASFSSNPVTPGASTVLTISGISVQNLGSFQLSLNASSAIGPQSEELGLNVTTVPGSTDLLFPLNGATAVAAGSPLEWSPDPSATQFDVQIATDASFSNVVETANGVTTSEYTPISATAQSTIYYWRVRGVNACGNGPWSISRSFTTATCVNVTIRITTDRYGEETTWRVVQGATIFASGGPYSRLSANGTQVQTAVSVCLPEGCYELQVFDSFGDGNCCAYGQGIITVENGQDEVVATVSGNNFSSTQPGVAAFCISSGIRLSSKLWLDGPYRDADGLMSDALRTQGLLPLTEPYTALGFAQIAGGGAEEFPAALGSVAGDDAIVDWVRLELRSAADATEVLASRQALLQCDGDIVDVDGVSPVLFRVPQGSYFVAVRHRNHLGCMSASPIAFSGTPVELDFGDPATATFGTNARRLASGKAHLWNGNVVRDGRLAYTGPQNDRDPILSTVGGVVPTGTVSGYRVEDVNMDGVVKYTGQGNDRDPILQAIGGIVATSVRTEQLP